MRINDRSSNNWKCITQELKKARWKGWTILNLESLEVRRLHFDLAMYFKIIHNLVDLNFDDLFVWSHGGVRMRGTISSWNN